MRLLLEVKLGAEGDVPLLLGILPIPRVEEVVPRWRTIWLELPVLDLREALPLDRRAGRDDEPERDGGFDLRELDPELCLLPELFDDDEGGDFLRFSLAGEADVISITAPIAVSSAVISFSFDSRMICASDKSCFQQKTAGCKNFIAYHYKPAITICQVCRTANKWRAGNRWFPLCFLLSLFRISTSGSHRGRRLPPCAGIRH
ncbi:MAG: hypothetical protein ACYSWW_07105 [Planctomycetota bacterium]|jgi:hypothetical protein